MKTKLNRKSSCAVITLPVRAVREHSSALSKSIQDIVKQDFRKIVFDLTDTEMLDSATLGVLIHARREHSQADLEMVIANAKGYVKGLLDNAKFSSLFRMENGEVCA